MIKNDKSNLSAASAAGVLKAPNLSFLISLLLRKQGMFALLQGNRAALDIPHVALTKSKDRLDERQVSADQRCQCCPAFCAKKSH